MQKPSNGFVLQAEKREGSEQMNDMLGKETPSDKTDKTLGTESDSTTNVYKLIPMGRVVVSVRIRPEIKKALNRYCRANGSSICHVFEGLVVGLLYGVNEQIEFVNKSPTINLKLGREVMRRRRYAQTEAESAEHCEATNEPTCDFSSCKYPPKIQFQHVSGRTMNVCERHIHHLQSDSKWKLIGGAQNG